MRSLVFTVVTAVYMTACLTTMHWIGSIITALVVVPISLAGYYWGWKRALIIGLFFMVLVNPLLISRAGLDWHDILVHRNGFIGAAAALFLGLFVGHFSMLSRRLSFELRNRSLAEAQLRKVNSRLKTVMTTVPSAIFTAGPDSVINSWNRMAAVITGVPAEDAVGKKCFEVWTCKACENGCGIWDPSKKKPLFGKEVEISLRNGKTIMVAKNIECLYDDSGVQIGGIESFVDVTEQHKYQEALRNKNQQITDFTAVVTHDLKKPLQSLKTVTAMTELMAAKGDFARISEMTSMARSVQNYMQELLEDLLVTVKLEYSGIKPEKTETALDAFVAVIVDRFRFQVSEAKGEVTASVEPGLQIHTDLKMLDKILMNLIGNTLNYSNPERPPRIQLSTQKTAEGVLFVVADNGIGIPENERSTVFDKFKRGSNTQSRPGTGLGLFIVKSSVEALGGRIWMESKVGEGTTFYFTLPAEKPAQEEKS